MNYPETLKSFPLSEAQSSRWFQYQIDPDKRGQNNSAFCARIKGLTAKRLEEALNKLVQRHPLLRASFGLYNGELGYYIADNCKITLTVHDAQHLSEETLQQRVQDDCWHLFDLEHPLRVYASWYQCNQQEGVMMLTFDHLAVDGWSYWILLDELDALISDKPLEPESENNFNDYVEWQQKWLKSASAKKQQQFWQDKLAGNLAVSQWPPKNSVQTATGKIALNKILHNSLSHKLQAMALKYDNSLFAILLAAYQILLSHYTEQDDIIIGSIMPGRGRARWGKLVGEFINPIALRSQIDGDMTVQQHISQAAKTIRQGIENQKYPFTKVLEQLQLQRNTTVHPVFQTVMIFQKARYAGDLTAFWMAENHDTTVQWGDAELRPFPYLFYADMPVPLMVNILEAGDQIGYAFYYDTAVFDDEFISQLMQNLATVLENMADDEQQAVNRLPLMNEQERRQVLHDFNDTCKSFPQHALIHQCIEQQVERTPDAVALSFGNEQLSYSALNQRANQLAHALVNAGVRPDARVAICMERSPDMIISLLGILKAGAAYVPLDPEYPTDRLAHILSDSSPVVLLTHHGLQDQLPVTDIPVWVLDNSTEQDNISRQSSENPVPALLGLTSRHLAYVLYTSGSTGLPKGVMVEHTNVVNLLLSMQDILHITADDTMLASTTIGFDIAGLELYLPLISGNRIVLAPPMAARDPQKLATLITTQNIKIVQATPSAWRILLDSGWAGADIKAISGGEALPDELAQRLKEKTRSLWNLYGPTETTIWSTASANLLINQQDGHSQSQITIGRPIANTQIYILDKHNQPVPIGGTGEIHIGGAGVARGYFNRPELTTERFIPDPFSQSPDARMYKTGDLGRWLPDGSLTYLGRNDFQVKIRGLRIELGEIEARLTQCADIREAVVVARESGIGDKRLVAYIIPHQDCLPGINQLREQLSKTLADYMIPSAFVMMEAFPLTPNGKLDRKALPAPDHSAMSTREYAAPEGETQEQLAAIWQTLLGLDRISRYDNFFELGGHSLLLLQLQSEIKKTFDVELSIHQLFYHSTLCQLEECIIDSLLLQFDPESLQDIYKSIN
ncbi:Peptide synthetase XpsA [Xenorhabdus nematophila ATCC 19061]|uniref:Peptide synthetase XpsA n=1 Tax=Xenorhabdus nematophila (strain ATCC 19061 / DSM 3370 / CCUG 14189 / LMG 1036 / NCIMB 9965 / AN6) TaxID=406817 RepID=D3VIY0_XENNA|nr:non-ribosomal peptide synthetase [Xenorhabdus nematophila]CBJ90837.1 Peptide synthetase XpsA [Xenorhabdus nematophila ATCC 19061]CEE90266.1 Peptide synthetase PaxA [Xenorhabdus nematophila str. Anatoliense]CEE94163.1 Peptide synthetase PaxA [Xenorhabdus nematophila str. Anatoliense]CEK23674.1 Peptide synthetase PaxA [Xenorhabdus nematophila AN6/1]